MVAGGSRRHDADKLCDLCELLHLSVPGTFQLCAQSICYLLFLLPLLIIIITPTIETWVRLFNMTNFLPETKGVFCLQVARGKH